MKYIEKKLIEEYERWGLTVKIQKKKYLCIESEAENFVIKDKEVRTCKKYKYLGTILNQEGTDDQRIRIE